MFRDLINPTIMEKDFYKKVSGRLQECYKMNVIHLKVCDFCNEIVLIKQYYE